LTAYNGLADDSQEDSFYKCVSTGTSEGIALVYENNVLAALAILAPPKVDDIQADSSLSFFHLKELLLPIEIHRTVDDFNIQVGLYIFK